MRARASDIPTPGDGLSTRERFGGPQKRSAWNVRYDEQRQGLVVDIREVTVTEPSRMTLDHVLDEVTDETGIAEARITLLVLGLDVLAHGLGDIGGHRVADFNRHRHEDLH